MFDYYDIPDERPRTVHERSDEPLYRQFAQTSPNHTKDRSSKSRKSWPGNEEEKSERKSNTLIVTKPPQLPKLDGITEVRMSQPSYFELMDDLTSKPPEQAGLLFGPINDELLVTHYVPEKGGVSTSITFTINADFVNRKIRIFKAAEMELKGIVHSHPGYFNRLSHGDLNYIDRLLGKPENRGTEAIFMPIVCRKRLIPFLVDEALNVSQPRFQLV